MNIHEYQGKSILKVLVAIQEGIVAETPSKLLKPAKQSYGNIQMRRCCY